MKVKICFKMRLKMMPVMKIRAISLLSKLNLHFIDCIVEGEQKADANVELTCLEAAFRALKLQFPHVDKIIVQSDNAKNLAGRQTMLLLPHVCRASGLKLVAYFHNEAQSGKDVCDTYVSHQQTHVDKYLVPLVHRIVYQSTLLWH